MEHVPSQSMAEAAIPCTACGVFFHPTTEKGRRCPPCRREYEAAWRARRRGEGLPASGSSTWDPKKRAAWQARYYALPLVKQRRAKAMRGYAKDPDLRPRHKARWRVRRALVAGILHRSTCVLCGSPKTEAHHEDYSRPLDVVWLCRRHHNEIHATAAEGRQP